MRPPGESRLRAASMATGSTSSSALTAARRAWNTRLAGWPRRRTAAGTAELTTSARASVVCTGRAATMAAAMRRAKRVSPCRTNKRASSSSLASSRNRAAVRASERSMRMSRGASAR